MWPGQHLAFRKKLERRRECVVRFLGEQDGKAEGDLKTALVGVLERHPVARAYLAQVAFGEGSARSVALCLKAPERKKIVTDVQAVFGQHFGTDQFLDILFFP